MQGAFSKNYAVKANNIFKYVLSLFGLSISPPQRQYFRWLLLITFIFCISCQLFLLIHVLINISVYLLYYKVNVGLILIAISFILLIPPILVTYIYFYCRRFAISSLLQKLSNLPSSKSYTKNQWKKQIFQIILFTLLHLTLIISHLTIFISNQPFMEWMCVIRLMSEKNCKVPSTLVKFEIFIIMEIVFLNVFCHFFLSTIYCFFSHICTLLVLHFQQMDDKIQKIINAKTNVSSHYQLLKFEEDFLTGEKMTNEVSRIFSSILLIWWSNVLVRICLRFRICLNAKSGVVGGVIELLIEILRLYVLYKRPSDINKKAKLVSENFALLRPTDGVHFACHHHFYFYLLSTQVGINVSDLFMINSQTILSVIATIFSYAVILLQTT
uniref:Gustatory receptor n=1 Tax=Strigamia maritima TaxID=126957 RepID=T1JLC8_STRMM